MPTQRSGDLTEATQVVAAASPGGRDLRAWLLAICIVLVGGGVGILLAVRHNSLRPAAATPPASAGRAEPRTVTVAPADDPATHRRASQPAALLSVPDVTGERFSDAQKQLRGAGLVADVRRVSSSQPKQTVVEQSPATGATAARGDHVLLTISLGTKKDKGNGHHRGRHKHEEG